MSKPIVKYDAQKFNVIEVGSSAVVCTIDHPYAGRSDPDGMVRTSTVISHDEETGRFETKNTIYEVEA